MLKFLVYILRYYMVNFIGADNSPIEWYANLFLCINSSQLTFHKLNGWRDND